MTGKACVVLLPVQNIKLGASKSLNLKNNSTLILALTNGSSNISKIHQNYMRRWIKIPNKKPR